MSLGQLIKGTGPCSDWLRAGGLLDALSPDRNGLLFGKTYGLSSEGGVIGVQLNPGESNFTAIQKSKIETELAKAVLLPAPPIKPTREEEQATTIADLMARIEALEAR